MESDSDTWLKEVGNEIGRLSNVIDNRVIATNTIVLIRKGEVPKGRTVKYANFVCYYCPFKSEPFRVRLIVGGDRLEYPEDTLSPVASLLESKILFNSKISDAFRGARFISCDLKDFSWKLQCQDQSI